MATNEILFRVKADTKEADKPVVELTSDLDELNQSYKQVIKSNTDLSASFEDVYGELKPLSGRLGELEDRMYELALAGQQNTQEFKDLQSEAVRYRQTLISVDKSVDQLAEQGRGLGAALQLGQGVAAGYGVIQSGMALLGSESEQLQETFVKLQLAQTALTSLEQLKISLDKQSIVVTKARAAGTAALTLIQNGYTAATTATTTAMQALRLAMLAVPFLAVIAAIAAIVVAVNEWSEAQDRVNKSLEEGEKQIERNRESYNRYFSELERGTVNEIALAKSRGATNEEIHALEMRQIKEREVARRAEMKLIEKEISIQRARYRLLLEQGNEDEAKAARESIETARAKYKELNALDGQYKTDLEIRQNEFDRQQQQQAEADQKERLSKWQAAQEKRKAEEEKAAQLRLDRERLIEDLLIQQIEDANIRKLAQIELQQDRERQELIAKYGEDTQLLKELEAKQALELQAVDKEIEEQAKAEADKIRQDEFTKQAEFAERERQNRMAYAQGRLLEMREDFEATQALQLELAEIEREQALAQENLTEGEKFLIQQQYDEKLRTLQEERAEHEKQLQQDVTDATQKTLEAGFNAAQGLSDALFANKLANAEKGSAKELAIQKKQFEINKKLQIAQAIMQGVQAVQAAYSSGSAIPIVGAVTGPLFAAAAAVQAALNINKIKNAKFEGGSADLSTPSVSAPSIPSPSDIVGGSETDSTLTAGLPGSNQPQQTEVVIVGSKIEANLKGMKQTEVITTVG